jgi:hypothetical protein
LDYLDNLARRWGSNLWAHFIERSEGQSKYMSAPVSASAICPCSHALVSHRIRVGQDGLALYCRACASECTNATVNAVAAFANFCDAGRLYALEFERKMPAGSANRFVRGGLNYLIRIVQLRDKFKGGYPGPKVTI